MLLNHTVAFDGALAEYPKNEIEKYSSFGKAVFNGSATPSLEKLTHNCSGAGLMELRQDMTRYADSPRAKNVSFNPLMRNAVFEVFSGGKEADKLGEATYSSEANPFMTDWSYRFFGSNYDRLKRVKAHCDPENMSWCTTCPGSEAHLSMRQLKETHVE